jgi:hypothetical protein
MPINIRDGASPVAPVMTALGDPCMLNLVTTIVPSRLTPKTGAPAPANRPFPRTDAIEVSVLYGGKWAFVSVIG